MQVQHESLSYSMLLFAELFYYKEKTWESDTGVETL